MIDESVIVSLRSDFLRGWFWVFLVGFLRFLSRSVRIVKSRDRKLEKGYLDQKVGAILRKFVLIKVVVVIKKFKSCLYLDLDKSATTKIKVLRIP